MRPTSPQQQEPEPTPRQETPPQQPAQDQYIPPEQPSNIPIYVAAIVAVALLVGALFYFLRPHK